MSGMWKRSHGRTSEAPPDERGGYRYVRPTATAPHLDSTLDLLPYQSAPPKATGIYSNNCPLSPSGFAVPVKPDRPSISIPVRVISEQYTSPAQCAMSTHTIRNVRSGAAVRT